jgi:hypothetical protein
MQKSHVSAHNNGIQYQKLILTMKYNIVDGNAMACKHSTNIIRKYSLQTILTGPFCSLLPTASTVEA